MLQKIFNTENSPRVVDNKTIPSATTKVNMIGTKRKAEVTKEKHQKKPKISKPIVEEKPIKEKKSKKPIVKAPIESESDSIESSEDESDGGVELEDEVDEDVDMDRDEETGPSAKNGLHPDRVKKVEANSMDTLACWNSMVLNYT